MNYSVVETAVILVIGVLGVVALFGLFVMAYWFVTEIKNYFR